MLYNFIVINIIVFKKNQKISVMISLWVYKQQNGYFL